MERREIGFYLDFLQNINLGRNKSVFYSEGRKEKRKRHGKSVVFSLSIFLTAIDKTNILETIWNKGVKERKRVRQEEEYSQYLLNLIKTHHELFLALKINQKKPPTEQRNRKRIPRHMTLYTLEMTLNQYLVN